METQLLTDPRIDLIASAEPARAGTARNDRDGGPWGVHPKDDEVHSSDHVIHQALAAHEDTLEDWTSATGDLAERARSVRGWLTDLWDRLGAAANSPIQSADTLEVV